MSKRHHLKTWPEHFAAVVHPDPTQRKTVELRKDDRQYEVGDVLVLQEYDISIGYTGREAERLVTHITRGEEWLQHGHVALSISELPQVTCKTLKAKWVFEKPDAEIWRTSGEYDTKDEAIAAGRAYFTENLDDLGFEEDELAEGAKPTFSVGRQRSVVFGITSGMTDFIIERIGEQAYDEVGEVAEEWPDESKEQSADLKQMLNATLQEWIDKHNLQPRFYAISDIEEVPLLPNEAVST